MESKQDPHANLFLISMDTWQNTKKLISECNSLNPKFDFNEEAHVEGAVIETISIDNEWFYIVKLNDIDLNLIAKCLSKYTPGIQPQHCEWDPRTETFSIKIGIYGGNLSFSKFLDLITTRTFNNKEAK